MRGAAHFDCRSPASDFEVVFGIYWETCKVVIDALKDLVERLANELRDYVHDTEVPRPPMPIEFTFCVSGKAGSKPQPDLYPHLMWAIPTRRPASPLMWFDFVFAFVTVH